ncbi:hypothetical protein AN618_22120 [Fervidicola ferrireducens]|uniref:Uncharacterized protein n=2 Tax=Fervidicola ferrireducens TaxID=520764 RepID=A0A140L280_9FIRM|nr:hypothetical protein AN618_22120 [Fervidicola ferrireducens]
MVEKERLLELIKNEDKKNPYTDEQLAAGWSSNYGNYTTKDSAFINLLMNTMKLFWIHISQVTIPPLAIVIFYLDVSAYASIKL